MYFFFIEGSMATGLTKDDVIELLDDDDVELDDNFASGSDDDLGFDIDEF